MLQANLSPSLRHRCHSEENFNLWPNDISGGFQKRLEFKEWARLQLSRFFGKRMSRCWQQHANSNLSETHFLKPRQAMRLVASNSRTVSVDKRGARKSKVLAATRALWPTVRRLHEQKQQGQQRRPCYHDKRRSSQLD